MSCCDTEMKHTICLCFFTRNTVILPHVLHSFNLTILKPKLWKYHTFCTISKPKLWYYHAFLQSFKAKAVISLHFYIFHTVWSQNCDMSSFLAYLWNHKLILPHVLHSLKPKTAIWPHVLHSFRAKTVISPVVFHSLEIKPMMFLHLLRSFGSKTVKLPHVLTFFWRADLCAACSFRTALQKMHCKKVHEVGVECCQMGRRPGSLQPSQAEACRKEI